ncbi:hypothetical protein [Curtobacterium oceanosedimentum]|uniref:hypothetical protein n=1 Tax=Curtobacterium oceanosedimentum TaxID=465820 RepID=UPI00128EA7C8|nr:hypothetical protein [Curtobacterium oceanosedimentum]
MGAGLGSTGLAGVLTGGIQLTRRSRLRKSIEASYAVLANLENGSAAHAALKAAIASDGTRLAALTLIGFPRSTVGFFRFAWLYVVIFIGVAFVAVASTGPRRPTKSESIEPVDPVVLVEWSFAALAFLIAVIFALSAMLRERRDRFIILTERGVPPREAVRRVGALGPVAQFEAYLWSAASMRSPGILAIPWAAPITVVPRLLRLKRLRMRRQ